MDQRPDFSWVLIPMLLINVPLMAATIWAYVRIIQKAGYSGWNVLWAFVPVGNIIMLFVFAFSEWPVNVRLRELETQVFGQTPPPSLGRRA